MKKTGKKSLSAIKTAADARQFEKEVRAVYKKLGLPAKNSTAPGEASFFDKVEVFYCSCAGV